MKQGPGIIKVLKANPDEDEVLTITGWEDYNHHQKEKTKYGSTIIRFLVQDVEDDEFHFWYSFVKDEVKTSKKGKMQFIGDYGAISFSYFDAGEISEYFTIVNPRPLKEGEDFITTLLQSLSRYQPDYDLDTWKDQMHAYGCNIENLARGNVRGLNELLDHYAERQAYVGCLFTKKGENQNIENHYQTIFRTDGDVPPYYIQRLEEFERGYNPIRGEIDLKAIIGEY